MTWHDTNISRIVAAFDEIAWMWRFKLEGGFSLDFFLAVSRNVADLELSHTVFQSALQISPVCLSVLHKVDGKLESFWGKWLFSTNDSSFLSKATL